MLQILWERGFIKPGAKETDYTLEGKKDVTGNILPQSSLKRIMSVLPDFENEETLLQYYGRLLGVTVDRTPKCHPELAGEGIEYTWGGAKGFYCRLKISEKRTNIQ